VTGESIHLNTVRLLLKPVTADDFDQVYAMFTNEFVKKYLFDDEIISKEKVQSFIETSTQTFIEKHYGLWIIQLKSADEAIGFTGLWPFFDEAQPQLLYALLPNFTGCGYAIEASLKVIDYAFSKLGFSYLDASCDTPNSSSHQTALAIGMDKIREDTIDGKPTTFYRIYRQR